MRHWLNTLARSTRLGRLAALGLGGALAVALALLVPGIAHAAPRDDLKTAYNSAIEAFNNLELDSAKQAIDGAVSRADAAGLSGDPALAPLLALRGGILYTESGDKAGTSAAFEKAVQADYNVQLPIELRSEDLQALLDDARSRVGTKPAESIVHDAPTTKTLGGDLEFVALAGVPLPDNAQVALYWRKVGETDFKAIEMDAFGNLATATLPASDHGGSDVEYFLYVFDQNQQALANKGDQEAPLLFKMSDAKPAGGVPPGPGTPPDKPPKKPQGPPGLPRVFINLGFGTGFGVATKNATAELTYRQFTPQNPNFVYGRREQACAIERWFAVEGPLASTQAEFDTHLQTLQQAEMADGVTILPAPRDELTFAYDPRSCKERHPVTPGIAVAPFHIAPEIAIRIGRPFVIGVFSRLQVVTGSKVFRENPDGNVPITEDFFTDVATTMPNGVRDRPPFSWTIGLKAKYFLRKDEHKLRPYIGLFGGFGSARLRIDMGFSNDTNGNSVPDTQEVGADAPGQPPDPNQCEPVWPWNNACTDPVAPGAGDNLNAQLVATGADPANRIDTVRIGRGFVGGLAGIYYKLHKNFGLFAELNIGGWFPQNSTVLFDLNVGPAITF